MDGIKKLVPAILLSFVVSFMLFVYEPIVMYANNINDFWFDFYAMAGPISLAFSICFLVGIVIFSIVYFISKHFKKMKIYYYALAVVFCCFFCAYIHGNFLASWLPSLDGDAIDWWNLLPNLVSIIVCLAIIAVTIILIRKCSVEKTVKYFGYASIIIFAMLGVSLISTFVTTSALEPKEVQVYATKKNINTFSSKQNFLILLVDTVDAKPFAKVISENNDYQKTLSDFTYYPDTMSGYPYTINSVPFIFSGEWNENTKELADYSTDAFNNSKFFDALFASDYSANFYNDSFTWKSEKALNFDNLTTEKKNLRVKSFLKQEFRYLLFKYLPYPLKIFSHVEEMDFSVGATTDRKDLYEWYDDLNYINITEENPTIEEQKHFQYLHLEGAHPPFNYDANFNRVPGTYEDKIKVTMAIITAYLDRLKSAGVYDNSTIVIMSDHGYVETRQNPILLIKTAGEKQPEMKVSDKPISHIDLCQTFTELLNGASNDEIFQNIDKNRTRRFLWHEGENHIIEYEQRGKAWDSSTLTPTGKEFNL